MAVDGQKEVKPSNPLERANEEILQWIFSTGTEDQKKKILDELQARIRKWELRRNYAQARMEYAEHVLEKVTSSEPL